VKTYYDLLSVPSNADADTIKKAFRREIARYHPDKVIHLGPEFQEMAATRAAELTVAYKTLSDPALREQYDASMEGFGPPPTVPHDPPPPEPVAAEPRVQPPVEPDSQTPIPPSGKRLFETERAGRDQILRRAIAERVRAVVQTLYGAVETPAVRGFDAALVPVAKPRFMGSHPPRVLVKVNEVADAAAITEAWNTAARARVHAGKSPVVVLLFGRQLSPPRELLRAMEAVSRQRKIADGPDELVVVVVDTSDWTCHLPNDVSAVVRKLVGQICA
jgi:hypothetical protein